MEFANQPSPVAMTTGQPSYQSTPDTASRKRHREDGGGSSGEDGEGEYDDVKLGSGAAVGGQGKSDRPLQRSCEECKRRKVKVSVLGGSSAQLGLQQLADPPSLVAVRSPNPLRQLYTTWHLLGV